MSLNSKDLAADLEGGGCNCVEVAEGAPLGAPSSITWFPKVRSGAEVEADVLRSRFLSSITSDSLAPSLLESMRTVMPSSVRDSFARLLS